MASKLEEYSEKVMMIGFTSFCVLVTLALFGVWLWFAFTLKWYYTILVIVGGIPFASFLVWLFASGYEDYKNPRSIAYPTFPDLLDPDLHTQDSPKQEVKQL